MSRLSSSSCSSRERARMEQISRSKGWCKWFLVLIIVALIVEAIVIMVMKKKSDNLVRIILDVFGRGERKREKVLYSRER